MARRGYGDTPKKKTREQKLIELARKRFKLAQDATTAQRTRELDDIRFYNGEQWPQAMLDARKGQNASNGLPPVPERPSLVINKVQAPVRQVLNEERQSDMGIEIVPADDFGSLDDTIDHTEIELREGLLRKIQRDSHAADAWTWAFARAVIAGTGYVGVMTRYAEGKTNDQEIYFRRFYNQACVTLDPAHEQPDGSDAEWGFVWTDVPLEQYQAEYPEDAANNKNRLTEVSDADWRALGDEAPGWFIGKDDETRSVRVGEYWYTERAARDLCTAPDGSVHWRDELPDTVDTAEWPCRRVIQKSVCFVKMDGVQILEETDWVGKYIPIIKVLGDELQPVDGERRCQGMVRPSRDSQRGFNYMISKQVETVGLTPIPPYLVEEGTIEGYEEWYLAANTRTLPYLPYKRSNYASQEANPPQVVQRASQIQDIAISIREFDAAIKSTTIVPEPTLGEVDPQLKSGKAINAILAQARQGTSNFLDNLARSMNYGARIVNNLLPAIYGRPGRLARMVTGQGEQQQIVIGQPFVSDPNGRPVPVNEGAQNAKTYKLTPDADFNVAVKITRSYDTRREQAAAMLGELIGASPELMTWFGDLFFKYQDGPGHQEMAERAKAMLNPQIQQQLAQDKQQPIPPMAQAQMAQMGQLIQQLSQELQAKTQVIETDRVKAERDAALEKEKQQAETFRAQLEAQNRLEIEKLKIAGDLLKTRATLEAKQTEAMIDAAIGQVDAEVAAAGEREEREAVSQENERDRQFQREEGAAGRQQERELTAAQLQAQREAAQDAKAE